MLRYLLVMLATALLSGCAGLHVKPAPDYASTLPDSRTIRVAFDQNGDIYPPDESVVPWSQIRMKWLGERLGRNAFLLSELEVDGRKPYSEIKPKLQADAVRRLNAMLSPGDTLVVLAHGFNESYEDAQENFRGFREALGDYKGPILEVHWDGLVIPFGGPGEFARATFWQNALLYSNVAGQHGLRRLLNGIDKPVHLRMLTFSRGAAVALSALTDPAYDTPFEKFTRTAVPFRSDRFQTIKLGMVAPAVGSGHVRSEADAQLSGRPVDLIVGFNDKDFALRKLVGVPRVGGDTSLGASSDFLQGVLDQPWRNLRVKAVVFTHGSKHGLANYTGREGQAGPASMQCLLYHLDLRAKECAPEVSVRSAKP